MGSAAGGPGQAPPGLNVWFAGSFFLGLSLWFPSYLLYLPLMPASMVFPPAAPLFLLPPPLPLGREGAAAFGGPGGPSAPRGQPNQNPQAGAWGFLGRAAPRRRPPGAVGGNCSPPGSRGPCLGRGLSGGPGCWCSYRSGKKGSPGRTTPAPGRTANPVPRHSPGPGSPSSRPIGT